MPTQPSHSHPMQVPHFTTEQSRQRLLSAVLAYANGGANFFATPREQHYLAQFQRGRLTIDEVVYYLESAKSF